MVLMLSATGAVAAGRAYAPKDVPNVNVADKSRYVSDPAGLVDPAVRARVDARLADLRARTTAEVAVAVVPSIGDIDPESFTEELFRTWGLGKSDKDNGLLLLIAPDDRLARIETGYGVEGVITDVAAATIIRRDIAPAMREGNLDAALDAATASIAGAMLDPAVADELRSSRPDGQRREAEALDGSAFTGLLMVIAGAAFVAGWVVLIGKMVKLRKASRHERALQMRRVLPLMWGLAVCSAGAGVFAAVWAWLYYRRQRHHRVRCDTCGARMRRLSEEEDNALLSDSQDLEEQIGSVDYDVWECPQCATVERLRFPEPQTKYTECPACGTVAMHEIGTKTLVPATTQQPGRGEHIFECEYCHHRKRTPFEIARKVDPAAAAIAAGAILGSMGRGGGGGGFSGGGFGGGMSGGGGATGRW